MKNFLLLVLVCFTGCAVNSVSLRDFDDAGYERETKVKSFTLFDGKNTIDKQKVSVGATHSIGQTGMAQESSSTNMIEALKTVQTIVEKLSPK